MNHNILTLNHKREGLGDEQMLCQLCSLKLAGLLCSNCMISAFLLQKRESSKNHKHQQGCCQHFCKIDGWHLRSGWNDVTAKSISGGFPELQGISGNSKNGRSHVRGLAAVSRALTPSGKLPFSRTPLSGEGSMQSL